MPSMVGAMTADERELSLPDFLYRTDFEVGVALPEGGPVIAGVRALAALDRQIASLSSGYTAVLDALEAKNALNGVAVSTVPCWDFSLTVEHVEGGGDVGQKGKAPEQYTAASYRHVGVPDLWAKLRQYREQLDQAVNARIEVELQVTPWLREDAGVPWGIEMWRARSVSGVKGWRFTYGPGVAVTLRVVDNAD